MRKYIFGMMAAFAAVLMTSCSADEGTEPGGDTKAYVQTNTYNVAPPLDADADFLVRVSTNSAVKGAYILLEKHDDYSKHIAEMGKDAYNDYVVKNGGVVKGVAGRSEVDTTFYGLKGEYMATVVAVGNNGQAQAADSVSFTGIAWNKVCDGTFTFGPEAQQLFGLTSVVTELDQDADDTAQYRIKNVFGTGYNIKFRRYSLTYKDEEDGEYKVCLVPGQATPFSSKQYGRVFFADAYTYQVANPEGGYFPNHKVKLNLVYYAGKTQFTDPDMVVFTPAN